MSDDSRLRFRIWIAAKLVDEAWVDVFNPDAEQRVETIKARHGALTEDANRDDLPWLVEIYDPAKPEHEAYYRFGTDEAGMIDPQSAGDALHPWNVRPDA